MTICFFSGVTNHEFSVEEVRLVEFDHIAMLALHQDVDFHNKIVQIRLVVNLNLLQRRICSGRLVPSLNVHHPPVWQKLTSETFFNHQKYHKISTDSNQV